MSTTDTRLSLAEAQFSAEKFRDLFPASCYETWTFAGSLRRKCPDVGDLEHVVVARFEADLFGGPGVNLLLRRADELAAALTVARHAYPDGRTRWGQKYRGFDFGCLGVTATHELFVADEHNLGPTLAIRTGPGEFSKRLVTGLLRNGRRNDKGYVWECDACPSGYASARAGDRTRCGPTCPRCQGTGLVPVTRLSVPTEEAYFELCGVPYLSPEDRR